jgi:hypothetical protein
MQIRPTTYTRDDRLDIQLVEGPRGNGWLLRAPYPAPVQFYNYRLSRWQMAHIMHEHESWADYLVDFDTAMAMLASVEAPK